MELQENVRVDDTGGNDRKMLADGNDLRNFAIYKRDGYLLEEVNRGMVDVPKIDVSQLTSIKKTHSTRVHLHYPSLL
jgi:hypothetical protein